MCAKVVLPYPGGPESNRTCPVSFEHQPDVEVDVLVILPDLLVYRGSQTTRQFVYFQTIEVKEFGARKGSPPLPR